MVLEVHSDLIDVTVSGGMMLTDGDEIAAGFQRPDEAETLFGYHVGGGDACAIGVETDERTVAGDQNMLLLEPAGSGLFVDLSAARAEPSCVSPQPGYVFAAMSYGPVGGDPIAGDASSLIGLTAVPLAFAWEEEAPPASVVPTPTASASVGPAEVVWTSYTDELGWTIDVPAGWEQEVIDGSDGRRTYLGAAFASGPIRHTPGSPTSFEADQGVVLLEVYHAEGGPVDVPADDSAFPLAYDDLEPEEGGLRSSFRGDGLPFDLILRFGDLTPEQERILRRMVESIRFEPWSAGDGRNGWFDLGAAPPDGGRDIRANTLGDGYGSVIYVDEGVVTVFGLHSCGAAPEEFVGDVVQTRCDDGTVARYDRDGLPHPDNPPGTDVPLPTITAVISHDGHVLIRITDVPYD
jgi:hypothetical protein